MGSEPVRTMAERRFSTISPSFLCALKHSLRFLLRSEHVLRVLSPISPSLYELTSSIQNWTQHENSLKTAFFAQLERLPAWLSKSILLKYLPITTCLSASNIERSVTLTTY